MSRVSVVLFLPSEGSSTSALCHFLDFQSFDSTILTIVKVNFVRVNFVRVNFVKVQYGFVLQLQMLSLAAFIDKISNTDLGSNMWSVVEFGRNDKADWEASNSGME